MVDLNGRSFIVTGDASGIGRAAAVLFSDYGAYVTVADMDEVQGRRVSSQMVDNGGRTSFFECNVADEGDVSALVDEGVRASQRKIFPFSFVNPRTVFWVPIAPFFHQGV